MRKTIQCNTIKPSPQRALALGLAMVLNLAAAVPTLAAHVAAGPRPFCSAFMNASPILPALHPSPPTKK